MKNVLNVAVASILAASASIASADTVNYHYTVSVDDAYNVPGVTVDSTVFVTVSAERESPVYSGDANSGYASWDGNESKITVTVHTNGDPIEFKYGPDTYTGTDVSDWPVEGTSVTTHASNYQGYLMIDTVIEGYQIPNNLDQYPDIRGYSLLESGEQDPQNMFYMTLLGENDHSQIMGTVTRVMVDTVDAAPNQ